jgi:Ca-activated chloride channel homolog
MSTCPALWLPILVLGAAAQSAATVVPTIGPSFDPCSTTTLKAEPDLRSTPRNDVSPARLRADVELVQIPVSVVDRNDRVVENLRRDEFRLREDGADQRLSHLSWEESPLSATLVVDFSNSMRHGIPLARLGVLQLLERLAPHDETSLITVRERPELKLAFGADSQTIRTFVHSQGPKGGTALADAVMLAIQHVRTGRSRQRAIIVFSDGDDRDSRYRWPEVRRAAREADARIHFFALPGDPDPERAETIQFGRLELGAISRETGGRYFVVADRPQLLDVVRKLDLHWRYVLEYYPSNPQRDDRYRRVDVSVPGRTRDVRLFWRRGYSARQ